MAVMTMAGLFGEADLRRGAGERSFGRGLGYLDAVGDLETGVDQVTATVYGTDAYEVVLDLDDGGVTGECSCPHGQEGFFCKHLVAVGLTVLGQAGDVPAQRVAAAAKARSLESWLEGLSRDALLTLVREQVRADRGLRRRLELRAAAAGPDLSDVRARVRELLDVSGFSRYGAIEYADARAYSSQVDEVLPVIDGLIDGGQAAEAADIAGQALSAVLEALEQADDSDGYIGGSAQALADAHARACAAAPVDPVGLAAWLAGVGLGDGQMLGDFDAGAYHDALGESGKAEYRRLITQAWRANPSGWHEKYLMQGLLRTDGDVDALVAMYAAELLPSGYTHLMIAQELDQAGRAGEAPGVGRARPARGRRERGHPAGGLPGGSVRGRWGVRRGIGRTAERVRHRPYAGQLSRPAGRRAQSRAMGGGARACLGAAAKRCHRLHRAQPRRFRLERGPGVDQRADRRW